MQPGTPPQPRRCAERGRAFAVPGPRPTPAVARRHCLRPPSSSRCAGAAGAKAQQQPVAGLSLPGSLSALRGSRAGEPQRPALQNEEAPGSSPPQGAFLVPYFLMLAICGIPLFFLELALGQFSSLGPLAVWKISPLFKGAGAAMLLIVGLVAIYYNMIIAYVLFYLFASLTSNLPWEHCGNWWNTDLCHEHRGAQDRNGALPLNLTSTVSPSEEYWSRYVLHIQGSQGIGSPGQIRWNLCLCLLLAWVIVFLCILKGVKSSGKVVYFTATFPYLILLMLLVRGVTLPGAWKGIRFYLTPQFHHLLSSKVWIEAALQIFYSLGVGFGGLLTFASYNTFHQNIYRDTFIVTLGNAVTSILAGFAIFSVLGYMSQELGVPVDQVAKAGPGLAFVVYPQAMTMLPLSPFWSFLFFFMLLTLGLDSQFAFLETIVTAVTDEFPYYLRPKKAVFSGLICVAMYLMGLILTTDGGMYWLVLLDDYSASFGLMVVVITTCLAVTRVYGIQRFSRDIHMMLGFKPGLYFRACWLLLSPATLLALLVYSIVKYQPSEYGSYRFPAWAELLGILMGLLSCLMIPAGMLVAVLREEGSLWEVSPPLPSPHCLGSGPRPPLPTGVTLAMEPTVSETQGVVIICRHGA
uniref:Solute carrier family 6 member 7 n=1 Tax=Oryctolagus cuniculus TaxID=9986 RepID=A0A5F9DW48_RABIT